MRTILCILALTLCIMSSAYAQQKKPNLVFMISDQWRAQAVSFAKQDPVQTPTTDKLASGGVFFRNAICNTPICGPNRASTFSGMYVHSHKQNHNDKTLDPKTALIFDSLKSAGYKIAYIGKWHMDGEKAKGRNSDVPKERRHGIDYFLDSASGHKHFEREYRLNDEEIVNHGDGWQPPFEVEKGMEWMKANKDAPFALFISFGPPHTGSGKGYEGKRKAYTEIRVKSGYGYAAPKEYEALYTPPEKFINRKNASFENEDPKKASLRGSVPGYFGAITSIDHEMGRVVDWLKQNNLFEDTIIVVTSDHGEMMGSHNKMTKGIWFEEAMRIPAVFHWEGKLKIQDAPNAISSIDFMPTILDLMGIEIPNSVQGVSFAPLMLGKEQKNLPEARFFEFYGAADSPRDFRGVRTNEYTYVLAQHLPIYFKFNPDQKNPYGILYDNAKDPFQLKAIYFGETPDYDKVIKDLHEKLEKHLAGINDEFIAKDWKNDALAKKVRERLKKEREEKLSGKKVKRSKADDSDD